MPNRIPLQEPSYRRVIGTGAVVIESCFGIIFPSGKHVTIGGGDNQRLAVRVIAVGDKGRAGAVDESADGTQAVVDIMITGGGAYFLDEDFIDAYTVEVSGGYSAGGVAFFDDAVTVVDVFGKFSYHYEETR